MSLTIENVTIGGVEMKKIYSDELKKIQCIEDGNIYSIAYTTKNSPSTFRETTAYLDVITPGNAISAQDIIGLSSYIKESINLSSITEISADQVIGLSDYVENVIDMIDGSDDELIKVDLGGSAS